MTPRYLSYSDLKVSRCLRQEQPVVCHTETIRVMDTIMLYARMWRLVECFKIVCYPLQRLQVESRPSKFQPNTRLNLGCGNVVQLIPSIVHRDQYDTHFPQGHAQEEVSSKAYSFDHLA